MQMTISDLFHLQLQKYPFFSGGKKRPEEIHDFTLKISNFQPFFMKKLMQNQITEKNPKNKQI